MALLIPDGDNNRLVIKTVQENRQTVNIRAGSAGTIEHMAWATDNRLVIHTTNTLNAGSDRKPASAVAYINAGNGQLEVVAGHSIRSRLDSRMVQRGNILGRVMLLDAPTQPNAQQPFVKQTWMTGGLSAMEVLALNADTGHIRHLANLPDTAQRYFRPRIFMDRAGDLLLATGFEQELGQAIWRFADGKPERLAVRGLGDAAGVTVLNVSPDGDLLLNDYTASDTGRLVRGTLAQLADVSQFVSLTETSAHPSVEPTIAYVDGVGAVWAVRYDPDNPTFVYPQPNHPLAAVHRRLRRTMDTSNIHVTSVTRASDAAVVRVDSPVSPPTFYLVDTYKGTATFLFRTHATLATSALSAQLPLSMTVRDGLTLHGYITLPRRGTGKKLPLVVLVHDNPFLARDRWGFDPVVQLLANRGFAVLQLNYRGSAGYGSALLRAGFGQWAHGQLNDLSDAVQWLVREGTVDANRICMMGSGLGAWAAMMSAVHTTDLRCVVGINGLYDLRQASSRDGGMDYGTQRLVALGVGQKPTELESASPKLLTEKIGVPVFIGYLEGLNGVGDDASRDMLDALQRKKRPVGSYLMRLGMYDRVQRKHRLRMYGEILDFLQHNTVPDGR
ncbi:MAG: prolyl oligopeptidase family serine peptidase [Pseudomonadales bacterium]